MPIGVCSIGDIISICLLAKDLVEALNSSRGASSEYQEIIRELWGLERALLQIDLLSRTRDDTPELNALHETARRSAEDCRGCIAGFLEKVRKYAPSLSKAGSGNIIRDASRKIQWQVMQSSDVSKFRAEINAHSHSMNMLLATWNVKEMISNDKKLNSRLSDSERKAETEMQKQTSLIKDVRERLKENNKLISTVTMKVTNGLPLQWFRQLGLEMKNMMNKIFRTNVATYEAVLAIQRVLPSPSERDPFVLEDAIGRISPVHMDFINSWDAFDAILRIRFQNVQGYDKVQNNEYIFQECATRREITRSRPWECAFLPGQRIDMSFVFTNKAEQAEETRSNSCPSCHEVSNQSQNFDSQCARCGIWYQRITEIIDVDTPPIVSPAPENIKFGKHAFQEQTFGPKRPSKFPSISLKRKLDSTKLSEDDIALFKRVRLITSKERIRPPHNPFEHVQISDADLSLLAMARHKAEEEKAWEGFREKEKILGSIHPDTLASLRNLIRTLRNAGKCPVVEDILKPFLETKELMLIGKNPEILRLLMSDLMIAFVGQKKLDSAEALWSRGTALFALKASRDENQALIRDFETSYLFRKSRKTAVLEQVTKTSIEKKSSSFDEVIEHEYLRARKTAVLEQVPKTSIEEESSFFEEASEHEDPSPRNPSFEEMTSRLMQDLAGKESENKLAAVKMFEAIDGFTPPRAGSGKFVSSEACDGEWRGRKRKRIS